jgi:hypothetical protein
VEIVGLLKTMGRLFKQDLEMGRCGSIIRRSLSIRIRYATCRAEASEEERRMPERRQNGNATTTSTILTNEIAQPEEKEHA